jgi:hypothetical protein
LSVRVDLRVSQLFILTPSGLPGLEARCFFILVVAGSLAAIRWRWGRFLKLLASMMVEWASSGFIRSSTAMKLYRLVFGRTEAVFEQLARASLGELLVVHVERLLVSSERGSLCSCDLHNVEEDEAR